MTAYQRFEAIRLIAHSLSILSQQRPDLSGVALALDRAAALIRRCLNAGAEDALTTTQPED